MFTTNEMISMQTEKEMSERRKERIVSYPAPRELSTPTDLDPEEARSIVEAVNPLIADAFALFIKTKNYHWHVTGSHYRDYHLLFDEQADSILASVDPLAERVRRVGGSTVRSVAHIGQMQTICDDDRDFVPPDEMISELLADNMRMAKSLRSAIKIADENRDAPTSDLLQQTLNETEKRVWFLYEISMGGEPQNY